MKLKHNFTRPVVFVIGLNKSGTSSLHKLFEKEGNLGESAHCYHMEKRLSNILYENQKNNKPLLWGLDNIGYFSDIEDPSNCEFLMKDVEFIRELKRTYPSSIFILNGRNTEKFLESRMNHNKGRYKEQWAYCHNINTDKGKKEIKKVMLQQLQDHFENMRQLFELEPDRLLFFNIEKDDPNILREFIGIPNNDSPLPWVNKTLQNEKN